MDDYRQPDTPETANEVEMLLDQQAEQAVPNEASKETSADMKAEPVNLEEIVQPKGAARRSKRAVRRTDGGSTRAARGIRAD